MTYALRDYQEDAVRDTLATFSKALKVYRTADLETSFALSAVTGAGKTVIASSVIDALFSGSETLDTQPDPHAVILWVTDDPSLNKQTMIRMSAAADGLQGKLVEINDAFDAEKFDSQTVYFLNIQKIYDTSTNYVTRKDGKRTFTIWETIKNTIEDRDRTLYLVLDEAHKGMKTAPDDSEKYSYVQKLINGHGEIPPVPVVWGISATPERFQEAMKGIGDRRSQLPSVSVDPIRVQNSGLLKDIIHLSVPDEKGQFDTSLLRDAVQATIESDKLWGNYAVNDGGQDQVVPLLVLQVPNSPTDADLERLIKTVYEEWKGLPLNAVAHVMSGYEDKTVGKYTMRKVAPEEVYEDTTIRVLVAKDAITTGWDCPRAEVMFSLRPAKERTHIAQLLGRMVRTPLARRIQSDERLNSVSCFLPNFDKKTVQEVADHLTGKKTLDPAKDDGTGQTGRQRIILKPLTVQKNLAVSEEVFTCFSKLPSVLKPNPAAKPVPRLLSFAASLSGNNLLADADSQAMSALHAVLDGQEVQHQAAVSERLDNVLTTDIALITASLKDSSIGTSQIKGAADARSVDDAFKSATRILGAKLAKSYASLRAERARAPKAKPDFRSARALVSALSMVPEVVEAVDQAADNLTQQWKSKFRVAITELAEDDQEEFENIYSANRGREYRDLELPEARIEETETADGGSVVTKDRHLLSDAEGNFPIGVPNDWEAAVIETELGRPSTVAWYRNPSHPTKYALKVPYEYEGGWRSLQPDFVFFSKVADGPVRASIVDPHNPGLPDALAKLKGLAEFVELDGSSFNRIESIATNASKELVVLNLKDSNVREAIRKAETAQDLYNDVALALKYS